MSELKQTDNERPDKPQALRAIFGILMICVYVGVGILFMIGYFDPIFTSWHWVKWVCGPLLVLYGIWRAYRQFKGID